jgi:hypothetical protein
MQIADWLMTNRPAFDPEPQRDILRRATLAYTDDADFTLKLVPEQPVRVTENMREAEHIAASLLAGISVEPMTGENHMEIIERLLRILGERVQAGLQSGGMVDAKELMGLQAIGQHIANRIGMFAQDPQEKERAKTYGQMLGNFMNHVKAFEQRLRQAMQSQQQGNGGDGGEAAKKAAEIQMMQMEAQTKDALAQKSHVQRTAQRQVQFEQKLKQDSEKHQVELAKKDLEAATNIRIKRRESATEEPSGE